MPLHCQPGGLATAWASVPPHLTRVLSMSSVISGVLNALKLLQSIPGPCSARNPQGTAAGRCLLLGHTLHTFVPHF